MAKELDIDNKEAAIIYKELASSPEVYDQLQKLEVAETLLKEDPDAFEEYADKITAGDKEGAEAVLKSVKSEKFQARLADAREGQQLAQDVIAIQEVRAAEAALDNNKMSENAGNQSRMNSLGVGNVYSGLSEEGKTAVDGLMKNAKYYGLVVSTFLAGAEVTNDGITNTVAGAEVGLDFSSGKLFMIGHHESDTAFVGKVPIDPPTVPVFNNVYQNSIARQDANNYLLNNNKLADAMARMIGNFNPEGSTLVTADQANRYHNYQNAMLGAGKEVGEEQNLYKTLGVVADSGAVNMRRMFMIGQAMRLYIDDSMDQYKQHGDTVVGSEELITLTRIWDSETEFTLGDPTSFPSASELVALTEQRLNFEATGEIQIA